MKLNREKLLEQLEKVYPAIALNPIVPHYSYFKIFKNILQGWNGRVLISTTLLEGIEKDCGIPAESFLKLLRSLEDDQIELIFDGDEVKVRTNRVKGTFQVLKDVSLKEATMSNTIIEDEKDIQDLIKGLRICRMYVSKDQTAGPVRGVMIDKDILIATDRFRVVEWRLENTIPISCSVSPKFVDIIVKHREEIEKLSFTKLKEGKELSAILKDGTIVSTTGISGEYPDVLKYFPATGEYEEIRFPAEIFDVMERHVTFLSHVDLIDKESIIQISGNEATITSKDKLLEGTKNTLVDEIEISSSGEGKVEITVNPMFLKDIIGLCPYFKYYDTMGLILLEADKLRYVTQVREEE